MIINNLMNKNTIVNYNIKTLVSDGVSPSTVTGDSESHLEMLLQDKERLENEVMSLKSKLEGNVTQNSLMERLESQQRRITAFEISEKVIC